MEILTKFLTCVRVQTRNQKFKNSDDKIKKFTKNLLPKSNENEENEHNSFMRTILYAIRYQKENKTNICNKYDFKDLNNKELIEEVDEKKYE